MAENQALYDQNAQLHLSQCQNLESKKLLEMKDLHERLQYAQNEINQAKSENLFLKSQLKESQKNLEMMRGDYDLLQGKHEHERQEHSINAQHSADENTLLRDINGKIREQLEKTQTDLQNLMKESNFERLSLQTQLENIRIQAQSDSNLIQTLNKEIRSQQDEIKVLQARSAGLSDENAKLKIRGENDKVLLEQKEQIVGDLQAKITRVSQDLAENSKKFDQILRNKQIEIGKLKNDFSSLSKRNSRVHDKENYERRDAEAERANYLQNQLNMLESELGVKNQMVANLSTQLEGLQSRQQAAAESVLGKDNEICNLNRIILENEKLIFELKNKQSSSDQKERSAAAEQMRKLSLEKEEAERQLRQREEDIQRQKIEFQQSVQALSEKLNQFQAMHNQSVAKNEQFFANYQNLKA